MGWGDRGAAAPCPLPIPSQLINGPCKTGHAVHFARVKAPLRDRDLKGATWSDPA